MDKRKRVPVVYLAGGMRSNWQDKVIEAVGATALIIDPRRHGSKEEHAYTAWDLTGVDHADIVFGFIEADNPCGAGLALEFGYAHAQGKKLIYVEEPEFPHSRYFGMVRAISSHTTRITALSYGIIELQNAIHTWQPR